MHNELARLTPPPVSGENELEQAAFQQKFNPTITNHPNLPVIDWTLIGQSAPVLVNTPTQLPAAEAVIITWAEAEWAALEHVFCSGSTAMSYADRNKSSWSGWQQCTEDLPSTQPGEGWDYWGEYRLVQIGGKNVLLFKSNTHLDFPGESYLAQMIELLITKANPSLIMSIGTAGGAIPTDHIGTINTVNAGTLYAANEPESKWSEYSNNWQAAWGAVSKPDFSKLLFPVPTIQNDIASLVKQFNSYYQTSYTAEQLNNNNLNMGTTPPSVNNMTTAGTPLLTTSTFVVATTDGNLKDFACVEMDDAIIAMTCKNKGVAFGFVRNVSDPAQNSALPPKIQGSWGSAIYEAYGIYTSYNGALTAAAILYEQLA